MRVVIAKDSVLLREGMVQILARFDHRVAAAVRPDILKPGASLGGAGSP